MPTFNCTKLAERKTNESNKGDFTMMTATKRDQNWGSVFGLLTYSRLNQWFVTKCDALMKQTNAFVLHRWSVPNSFNWLLPSRFRCILFWCSPSTHEWLIARAVTSLCIRMDRNSSCGCNQLKKRSEVLLICSERLQPENTFLEFIKDWSGHSFRAAWFQH